MLLMFGTLLFCLAIGVPVFACLGIAAGLAMLQFGLDLLSAPQTIFESLDSFTLMAIPFYILAGNLMQTGGISRRLIHLANSIVGWLRGGLGASSILTCMFFATMSGSSSATTAAIGSSMIPAMEKKGYPKSFAAACVAVGGELGAIIPPSLTMIVYGLVANVSIGSMFIAGILPGLLVGLSLILTIVLVASVRGFDNVTRVSPRAWLCNVYVALKGSILALMMPVIILGGIYSGVFTATEASVVAVLYGLLVGGLIYRELTLRDLIRTFIDSAVMTGVIMLIVGCAALFAYMLTLNQVPQTFGRFIVDIAGGPIGFLLLANLLLFVAGMFMEAFALIIILVPILAPIAVQFGIDPIHFGMIMMVTLAMGLYTPPVGTTLYISAAIGRVSIVDTTKKLLLFYALAGIVILLVAYLPGLLFVPS